MASIGKIAKLGALVVVAVAGLIGGTWYYTTAIEPIHPQQGVYGMDGLEIWIDLNAAMPDFAREWGCKTLRDREKAALGGNSLPPYGCQPGFAAMEDTSAYQSMVDVNLTQATTGLDAAKSAAVKACFETRMAKAVTPEEMQGVSDFDQTVMSKVVVAISEAARTCRTEVAG
ncbi:MAG: hypothetical protein HC844_18855 [Tabrizicola sp.]|nr:hypothetical protein [Tabrizicola sp.]